MRRCFPEGVKRALLPVLAALSLAVASPALAARAAAKPVANQGIVNIYTTLGFQNASAAGTGMIVTPGGLVYTNNHVIRGATVLRAVDVLTHKSYTATVVATTSTTTWPCSSSRARRICGRSRSGRPRR